MTGVSWSNTFNKWKAQIKYKYKPYSLGYFDKKSDAIAARKAAEKDFGFHPNHGRAT